MSRRPYYPPMAITGGSSSDKALMTQYAFRALLPARNKLIASLVFIREWLRSPRAIGMVCPSGRFLARAMADSVPLSASESAARTGSKVSEDSFGDDLDGLVVELGAGTGTVTEELLRHGVHPQRLLVVERAEGMVELLRLRFPGLHVVQGDAAQLSRYLPQGARVSCIVSSLPLVSLPDEVRLGVINELHHLLGNTGQIIQYTYSWGKHFILQREGFHCASARRVWLNLPPAKIMRFINPPTSKLQD